MFLFLVVNGLRIKYVESLEYYYHIPPLAELETDLLEMTLFQTGIFDVTRRGRFGLHAMPAMMAHPRSRADAIISSNSNAPIPFR
jgi:hypothetical protein